MQFIPRNDSPAPRGRPTDPSSDQTGPGHSAARRGDALLPGTRLDEYEVERVIATSGFGLVYLATDRAFERRVALKEYLPDTLAVRAPDGVQVMLRAGSHAEAFERGQRAFVDEARLLARLDHPSLLHVLRYWEGNGTVYRAMPYYPGTPLTRLREAMGTPPDEATLRALLEGLLEPLSMLHAAGCIHREIAPANILLLPDDRPVLMDWGAARRAIVGDQARALMTLLAPSFAPLEVTAPTPQRPVGPWTDLYALAAVVRYCISGQLPPPAALRTMPADEPLGRLIARQKLVNPELHYSPSFIAAMDAALAPRAEDRPQSVADLRALLDNHPTAFGERIEPVFDAGADRWGSIDEPAPQEAAEPAAPPDDAWSPTIMMTPRVSPAPEQPAPMTAEREPPRDPAPPAETPAKTASTAPPETPRAEAPPPVERPPAPVAHPEPAAAPLPPPPVFEYREPQAPTPKSARAPDDRVDVRDPVSSYREQAGRRRRRVAVSATLLALVAIGAGAWWLQQQATNTEAQSALARAAKEDGLTANLPAMPRSPAPANAPAPVAAAPVAPQQESARVAASPAPAPAPVATSPAPAPAPVAAAPAPVAATPAPVATAPQPPPAPPPVAAATPVPTPTPTPPPATSEPAPVVAAAAPAADDTAPARRTSSASKGSTTRGGAVSGSGTRAASGRSSPPVGRAATVVAHATPQALQAQGPRDACGNRTQFSLYRCMQTQCAQPQWYAHPSCKRLRLRDEVD